VITSRRGFFGLLGGAAAAAIGAPEIEIVTRKIFLPPRGGWPGATFTGRELTMSLHDFAERFLRPAMLQVSSVIEADAQRIYDPAFVSGNRTHTINIKRPTIYQRDAFQFVVGDRFTIEGVTRATA
jgi:hypothetical protein